MTDDAEMTREKRWEGGVVVVREDDPKTGETIVRRYPAPTPRQDDDS